MQANHSDAGPPISTSILTIGVLATPVAWLLQICAGETLIAYTCFPHDAPLRGPLAPSVRCGVIGMSGALLLVGMFGTWLAWRNWRRLTQARRRQTGESAESTD